VWVPYPAPNTEFDLRIRQDVFRSSPRRRGSRINSSIRNQRRLGPRLRGDERMDCIFVMPGFMPGIHVSAASQGSRRGWPGQARP
jgi:hypothetical protein